MGSGQMQIRYDATVRVLPQGEYFVGRAENSAIVIDHRSVSRKHLRIHWSDGHWLVEDCGTTFGTFVGDERITQVRVDEPMTFHLVAPDGPAIAFVPVMDGQALGPPPGTRATGLLESSYALGPRMRIGRNEDNDIVIDDLGVSREHAELRLSRDGIYELVDLKSRNGTFVNGARVDRARLCNGDLVELGRHDFRFTDGRLDEYVDRGLIQFSAQRLVVEAADGRRLVDDVDFSLDERALLAIVGPSGSGKSTLLKALTGLRPIARGCVLYEQRDLHRDGAALRRRIGYVPQADLLHDGLTVRQSLGYTERLRLPDDVSATELTARVAEVLTQLSLDHRTDSRIDMLSGGERKRVNVATELLTEPSLLLLDEPASGLDAGLERTLMLMLRGLADDGHTVIVVTHSLDSLHLCDRVLVLAPGGTLAYFGSPDGIEKHFDGHELVDVFHEMSDSSDGDDWRDARHPGSDDADDGQTPTAGAATDVRVRVSARTWFGQLRALSSRFTSVLFSDRRNALLLVLQAPILGLLMAVALPTGELSLPGATEIRFVSTAALVLFVVLLGATWLGANNAIREIARETALFERETAVGVSTSAYVLSKAIVLGAITTAQAFVLVPIALSRQGGPLDAVVLGWPMGELMVAAALAGLASMSLALLVSASVRTPDRATTLLPIILILQFVLSAGGVLPEIIDKPVLREMSNVSSAQWGFAATASTADLNALQEFTNQLGDLRTVDAADPLPVIELLEEPPSPNNRWDHQSSSWLRSASALVALIAAPLVGAIVVLRRRRPLQ